MIELLDCMKLDQQVLLLQQTIYLVSIVFTCNTYLVMHWSM